MELTPLRNRTARDWIRAVEYAGFRRRKTGGSHHIYQHSDGRRVLLVYHNLNDTFGPKAIRQILQSNLWTEDDLRGGWGSSPDLHTLPARKNPRILPEVSFS
jgi:predicted RNA binding protein YcfA (HicA-like mRNA interferase family)